MSMAGEHLNSQTHLGTAKASWGTLAAPPGSAVKSTIPFTQLPDVPAGSPLATEWHHYRRVVGQLLADGQEGKWLLIKNDAIVGIWDSEAEADAVRQDRFLMQPVLMKQILADEPILRIGYNRLCRS